MIVRIFCFLFSFVLMFQTCDVEARVSQSLLNRAIKTPERYAQDMETLVSYLTENIKDDYDKAKVIAYWIASHVVYDNFLYYKGKVVRLREGVSCKDDLGDIFTTRTGVCCDYAELFAQMGAMAGLDVKFISGYASSEKPSLGLSDKKSGNYSHAWNSFKYKNKDILVDTTWMATGNLRKTGSTCHAHNQAIKKWMQSFNSRSYVFDVNDEWFDFGKNRRLKKTHIEEQPKR